MATPTGIPLLDHFAALPDPCQRGQTTSSRRRCGGHSGRATTGRCGVEAGGRLARAWRAWRGSDPRAGQGVAQFGTLPFRTGDPAREGFQLVLLVHRQPTDAPFMAEARQTLDPILLIAVRFEKRPRTASQSGAMSWPLSMIRPIRMAG